MSLRDRALEAAKESEAKSRKQARTRKRNAEQRARRSATEAFRKVLEIPEETEGELTLRDQDGVGFVTDYDGLDFLCTPSGNRPSSPWEVFVLLDGDEHKISNLAQLGKVLKAHGGAK